MCNQTETKVNPYEVSNYVLNTRRRRWGVTIRVRQSGHSRFVFITKSEHPRHMARWPQSTTTMLACKHRILLVNTCLKEYNQTYFFILTDDAEPGSFDSSGRHRRRLWRGPGCSVRCRPVRMSMSMIRATGDSGFNSPAIADLIHNNICID